MALACLVPGQAEGKVPPDGTTPASPASASSASPGDKSSAPPAGARAAPPVGARADSTSGFRGVFFRSTIGLAYVHAAGGDIVGGSTTLGGIAAALTLDIGGMIGRRFALAFEFSAVGSLTPLGVLGGVARTGISGTYYVLPSNIFVTSALRFPCIGGLSKFVGFGVGMGVSVGVGREWMISRSWAVGIKGHIFYDAMVGLFLGFLPAAELHVFGGGVAAVFTFHRPRARGK